MFSEKRREEIDMLFKERCYRLRGVGQKISCNIKQYETDTQIAMKFLYSTMPLSDIADYEETVFLDYVKHGIWLLNNIPYTKIIPEDLFLNYVMYHRINTEDIMPCRKFFYELITKELPGLYKQILKSELTESSLEKVIKNIVLMANYWCASQMTYRTTDERTAAPLTSFKAGYGRCGEESTFVVSVLRSIGIPARQVYVPRWSHCDDNHAWIEVWCAGKWNFLGACEPEEDLNRGWFLKASTRAMLIHSRWFGESGTLEEKIGKEGKVQMINNTSLYAKTKKVEITVVDVKGVSLEKVRVSFEVLNYAEFVPVATLFTNKEGKVTLNLGIGSIYIFASKEGKVAEKIINVENQTQVKMVLSNLKEDNFTALNLIAPSELNQRDEILSKNEQQLKDKKLQFAIKKRNNKMDEFAVQVECRLKDKQISDTLKKILYLSQGNYDEVLEFLNGEEKYFKEMLLNTLTKKDYIDLKHSVILDHYSYAMKFVELYSQDIFTQYILSPRIYIETIVPYRKYINENFNSEQKEQFFKEPEVIWSYIQDNIKEQQEEEYTELITSPIGCLKLKSASYLSQKILFVAICRSIGVPARLKKENLTIEYYRDEKFYNILEDRFKKGNLILNKNSDREWVYLENWSLANYQNGSYNTLNLKESKWHNNKLTVSLKEGMYRIITSNRLPNGNIYAYKNNFYLKEGTDKTFELLFREATVEETLQHSLITDFNVVDENSNEYLISTTLNKKNNIIIWLEEGKEPTEHILNELYEKKERFCKLDVNILFIVRTKQAIKNITVSKVLKEIPKVKILYSDFYKSAERTARAMYVDSDKLPLVVMTNEKLEGVYATSGYNVGTGEMLVKILGMFT